MSVCINFCFSLQIYEKNYTDGLLSELKRIKRYLFASEVGGYLTPLLGLPLDNGIAKIMGLQPIFCAGDDLKKLLCLRGTLQFGLAFPLRHP